VLEVRASQMPILLEDDQFVGRLNYFKMAATPDRVYGGTIGSSYQQQGLALSKQFKQNTSVSAPERAVEGAKVSSESAGPKMQAVDPEADDEDQIMELAFPSCETEISVYAKGRE
jgi:hypothetical protein